jgi:alanine-synthesizing transaminase
MYSRRLSFTAVENPLAALERSRRAAGAPLIDLTITNPTQVGIDYPAAALAAALGDPAVSRYQPAPLGPAAARAAVAAEYQRLGAAVAPAAIALSASSSESYAWLFKLLCDPGGTVLVPRPSYPLFDYLAGLEGVQARPYRLAVDLDGQWHVDWSSVEVAGASAIIVVSPNNPTGSYLRAGDRARLAGLAAEHRLPIIADEVFADFPLAPAADAVRTLAAQPPEGALGFCLGGLSKSCGLPQLKLGWIATVGDPALVAGALARLELVADTYLSVGTPVTAALPRLLALGGELRARIAERIAANRAQLVRALAGSACTPLPTEGGWSVIVRVPAIESDEAWALALLAEHDLLVQPGYFFDIEGLGATLVLSLLPEPALFAEGARRLAARAATLSCTA